MSTITVDPFSIGTPVGRWAGIGPYYAMFPVDFAFEVVQKYSTPGQGILDPFAGRASSVYAAAATNRRSLGIEINPVGWLYGKVKLHPAPKARVLSRVESLATIANTIDPAKLGSLPEFFRMCFAPRVLRYLLAARESLHWRRSVTDATVMAVLLVYLHGKEGQALSNQMRQGKSMSPDYSVRWWRERNLTPPDIAPQEFLRERVAWRYAKGLPELASSSVILGDSRVAARRVARGVTMGRETPFDLLFTSPPYYAITNYHYDQWLRLWMLGGSDRPVRLEGAYQKRFESRAAYRMLLEDVFGTCAKIMARDATVYVRTDARPFTFQTTLEVLCESFPHKTLETIPRPYRRNTQTALFGDKAQKPGEVDIILR
jgi:hypothetical protein